MFFLETWCIVLGWCFENMPPVYCVSVEVPEDVLEKLQKMTVALAERWVNMRVKMGERGMVFNQPRNSKNNCILIITYPLDLPPTQQQWQMKVYKDSLQLNVIILVVTATG